MQFDLTRALRGQKAIPNHPALRNTEGIPTSVYSPGASRQDAQLSQREAARHTDAYGGKQAIDWVYDCVGLYADATSTAPWHLEKPDGTPLVKKRTPGTPDEAELGPSDLYDLLERPNPFMPYDELVDLLIIDFLLVGNAYWYKFRNNAEGKPLALYRLAPSHVKIIPGSFGPKAYKYQPPGAKDPLNMKPEDVIHFKRPNPHSAYYGLGMIQGGGRAFDLELAITETMAHYFENRADPSMIVNSERRVPRDVFNKLRAQLRARSAGPRNAGELLVLEAGLKADTLSPSARDALFEELSKMSQDRVYAKFRASRILFGLSDQATADTITASRREFDNSTLRPFMDRIQRRITQGLCEPWDVDFKIDYRYQMAPEDVVKLGTDFAAVPGMKVREVRRFFASLGIEESTGDKKIDEEILNMPMEETGPTGQGGAADRPLGSEPGRPPKGQNTTSFPRSGTRKPTATKTRTPAASGKALTDRAAAVLERAEGKALAPDGAIVSVGNKLPGEKRPADPFAQDRSAEIDASLAFIQDGLSDAVHTLERELLDVAEGKALLRSGNGTSNVLGRIRNSPAWRAFRASVQEVLTEGARRAAQSGVMQSGLEPEDELDYDALAASVVNRPEGVRGIVATLKDRIARHVKEARAGDEDVRNTISAELRTWKENTLPGIADSEATEAYNEGTLSAAEAAGIKQVFVHEEDDAPDEACQEAAAQVWDIKTARARRKEHPRCRRAFIPMPESAVA